MRANGMGHHSNEHMTEMRKAKARKRSEEAQESAPLYQPAEWQGPARSFLDVQVAASPDLQHVTLTVKGPRRQMRKLVLYAIEQSTPYLADDDAQDPR